MSVCERVCACVRERVFAACYALMCTFVCVCVFILVLTCVRATARVHERIPVRPISLFRNKRARERRCCSPSACLPTLARGAIALEEKKKKDGRCIVFRTYKS